MKNTDSHKRLLYISQHRGMAELDLVLGRFATRYITNLSPQELQDFEKLLDAYDGDIFNWLTHKEPVPQMYDTPLFHKLMNYTHHDHALSS